MKQPQPSRHILIVEEPNFRKTVVLEEATYSLGRHSSNDIIIAAQKVSRHHATLLRRTDVKTNNYSYWILDGDLQGNRSRNGIYINGKKCLVHELKDGDTIKLSGDSQATYQVVTNITDSSVLQESPRKTATAHKGIVTSEQQEPKLLLQKETVLNKDTVINSFANETHENSEHIELLRLSSLAELSPQAIIESDLTGNITYSNSKANSTFAEITKNHPLVANLADLCNLENVSVIREIKIDNNYYRQTAYYLEESQLIRSYIRDITQEKLLRIELEEQNKQYQIIFENSSFGIIIISAITRKIIKINNFAAKYLEWERGDLADRYFDELIIEKENVLHRLHKILIEKRDYTGEVIFKKKDDSLIHTEIEINLLDSPTEPKFLIRIEANNHLSFPINRDRTGSLPRLENLQQQIRSAIANTNRNQKLLALLAVNINNFDSVVQAINTEKKVILLSSFAERLKASLRFGDLVAYGEEDKFFILMEDLGTIQEIAKISQRILDSLQQPFKIGEQQLSILSNIGIAVYPQDGDSAEFLFNNANSSLDKATQDGSCRYYFYNQSMNSQNSVMLKLESFLSNALERNEFILYYQPQVNVNSGNIQGIEALLRWQHPELGIVAPSSFISLAEETGLIIPIGHWVLKTACQQNKLWISQGFPPLRVSVNISPIQFQQPDLPLVVQQILAETQLQADLLELEIAANAVVENLEYSHNLLSQLQKIGVHISISDFSNSYNSWEQLKHIPFDTLKINRDFVRQLKDDPQDLAIISAMVALGRGFNLRVVAEGVETQEQIELLKSQDCEQMQGFWFSRPLAAEEATKLFPFDSLEESPSS